MSQSPDDEAVSTRGSNGSVALQDPIQGPYHTPTTFPQCNAVTSVDGLVETYTRSLLSSGNGYPLWEIAGNLNRPEEHIKRGVSIGDVGVLDPDGDFAFVFNIFHPADDPIHHHVLEGFEQISPPLERESEIQFTPDYFSPGSIVSSAGIDIEVTSNDPLDVKLSTTAREGAVLILPDGASREDLVPSSRSRLMDYIAEHSLGWHHLVCNRAPTEASYIPNGSLYLVTGCDKAKSYALCSIPRDSKNAGKRVKMRYTDKTSPPWGDNRPAATKSRTLLQGEGRSYAVFIRGIRVSLSDRLWIKELPYIAGGAYYNLLSTPILGFRSKIIRLKERFLGPSETDLDEKQKVHFHPSIIMSQVLLKKSPAANIAIIDDSIWCQMIAGHHLTIRTAVHFITEVMDSCETITRGKIVTLIPKSSPSSISTSKSQKPATSGLGSFGKNPRDELLREVRKILKPPWYTFVM